MGVLDAPYNPLTARYSPTMPAGLGWNTTRWPITFTLRDVAGSLRAIATPSISPEAVFDAVSTARSAPGATFYVNGATGADANDGSSGLPFKSIWKAVVAANTAAVPTKIVVDAATYFRTNNPWYNGGSGVLPTVDLAFIARNGRAIVGTFDPPGTPSRDATHLNTYSWTVASVNRVCDMTRTDRFGNYVELQQVSTAALCNVIGDSWALVAGTVYVNRRDQVAPSNTNTRLFRPSTFNVRATSNVSLYFGGTVAGDGFDFEGSGTTAVLDVTMTTPGSTARAICAVDCSFKYAGGATDTTARCVSIDSLPGIAYFLNCRGDGAQTDAFNSHNINSATLDGFPPHMLTVNCTGFDSGRPGQVSCNGWTTHENIIGLDACGYYKVSHGGMIRSIGTSKSWLLGTVAEDDHGDLWAASGVVPPTAFRVDDTAVYWCDRTRIAQPAGALAYVTAGAGAVIHKRGVGPTPLSDRHAGTSDTY